MKIIQPLTEPQLWTIEWLRECPTRIQTVKANLYEIEDGIGIFIIIEKYKDRIVCTVPADKVIVMLNSKHIKSNSNH